MNVPHFQQELDYSCLAACVRMVLAFYDSQHTESELRGLLKTRPGGTGPANVSVDERADCHQRSTRHDQCRHFQQSRWAGWQGLNGRVRDDDEGKKRPCAQAAGLIRRRRSRVLHRLLPLWAPANDAAFPVKGVPSQRREIVLYCCEKQ